MAIVLHLYTVNFFEERDCMSHVECYSVNIAHSLCDILCHLGIVASCDENIVSAALPQNRLSAVNEDVHNLYRKGYLAKSA